MRFVAAQEMMTTGIELALDVLRKKEGQAAVGRLLTRRL